MTLLRALTAAGLASGIIDRRPLLLLSPIGWFTRSVHSDEARAAARSRRFLYADGTVGRSPFHPSMDSAGQGRKPQPLPGRRSREEAPAAGALLVRPRPAMNGGWQALPPRTTRSPRR